MCHPRSNTRHRAECPRKIHLLTARKPRLEMRPLLRNDLPQIVWIRVVEQPAGLGQPEAAALPLRQLGALVEYRGDRVMAGTEPFLPLFADGLAQRGLDEVADRYLGAPP